MITRRTLTNDELKNAVSSGDFTEKIRKASGRVAVILTQSWCPQWIFMRSWLSRMEKNADITELSIFEAEYDRMPAFDDFRQFKESVFNNWEVPYVRYYADGKLVGESNFVSEQGFLDFFS